MGNDTDELAVADHFLEVILDGLLAQIVGPLLGGLGESLLLARVPSDAENSERKMVAFHRKRQIREGSSSDAGRIRAENHFSSHVHQFPARRGKEIGSHDDFELSHDDRRAFWFG